MDEKTAAALPVTRQRRGRGVPGFIFFVLGVCSFMFFTFMPFDFSINLQTLDCFGLSYEAHISGIEISVDDAPATIARKLVPVEAHIMSKCPDARDCLRELVLPAMQRVGDKVNFTLSFIGTPTDNDGVACKHGPAECLGNIIELCAQKLYPDPKTYLGFTMCLTRDYKEIPERSLIEDCALEHAIDFSALNECATKDDGALGMGMLRGSVQRSANAGVTKSCTVRVDEKIYCVRDDSKWTECPSGPGVNDLVIAVEKLYRSRSSS